jgi:hypothetical protein
MKKILLAYDVKGNKKEIAKLMSFLSPDIIHYEFENDKICIMTNDTVDEYKIKNDYERLKRRKKHFPCEIENIKF